MADRRGPHLGSDRRLVGRSGRGLVTRVLALLSVATFLLATPFAAPRAAESQSTLHGDIFVILATREAGTIAPELAGIAALRQPPFSAYGTLSLLASHPIDLVVGTPLEVPLPNGRILSVVSDARAADGRVPTRISINRPNESDYLPGVSVLLPPCEPVFLAGQSFSGGMLVIGVRLGDACR